VIDTDKLIEALEAECDRYTNDDPAHQEAVVDALWSVVLAVKKAARASRED
jgi:hypothetical protein